jgi:hypothetical protein
MALTVEQALWLKVVEAKETLLRVYADNTEMSAVHRGAAKSLAKCAAEGAYREWFNFITRERGYEAR